MEVEVDDETGEVEVIKVVNVNDVGRVVNWTGVKDSNTAERIWRWAGEN